MSPLKLATNINGDEEEIVPSVLQRVDEARAELETLFSDREEVEEWLSRVPLI